MSAVEEDLQRLHVVATLPEYDRVAAIKLARAALSPLLAPRQAPRYPIDALGALAPACQSIAQAGQVQPPMVGQCLLGAASLLTQGLYNVATLTGRAPLSLYLLTLGDSGDGKSTAQRTALAAVTGWQRDEVRRYTDQLKAFEEALASRKKSDPVPATPASPYRLVGDATVEGLRRDLMNGPSSQGIFTDEAAAILSGYGMSADNRAKSASTFSRLWDDGHLSVSRVTGGRAEKFGTRVALHWLIQPAAAYECTSDRLLSELGFWPRFLVAWPPAQAPRVARDFHPDTLAEVISYWERCRTLLAEPLPEDANDSPVLQLAPEARRLLGSAFERFEKEARLGGMQMVKPFALRATEQACRVAGVLAAFEGKSTVDERTAKGALDLVEYSLLTWLALTDEGAADPSGLHAIRLFEWLTNRPNWTEQLAVIPNRGPNCVRSKDKRDAAVAVLVQAGLAEVEGKTVMAVMPSTSNEVGVQS